jgi:nitronate monooxygenase
MAPGSGPPGLMETALTRHAGIEVPLIGGAMYPCSNPELVAAVSEAGALGIVQPISLVYVHGHGYREGLRYLRSLTAKPVGFNALIERSSRYYHERMVRWVDIALEEGIRFFVTSLGNPRWVVDKVHAAGGVVYHDVTERKWALKALDADVDGFIAVNNRAGGHPGPLGVEELLGAVGDLGRPVVCTRFIATPECRASEAYKQAIVRAGEDDIVWSERLTGVPVAVINTPWIRAMGTKAGPFARWMFRGRRTKHWMRTFYALRSLWQLKRASLDESGERDYWQAGKSVAGITSIEPAGDIVRRFAAALD